MGHPPGNFVFPFPVWSRCLSRTDVTRVTARGLRTLHSKKFDLRDSPARRDNFQWMPVRNAS